ncbi:uncharacterized protein LOC111649444 isoform X2 [Seriola lalandi dorsalis]|uniref:uncharacterized protein LOC111649444 isoform X2 n=1 Tax=Seriola lalandi dorsalis TaxID=1841481 RepID=UPI000C6FC3ED|nr:uncharacterized protein LOC111649444 isoform X2 [Seriola lalandi dorsalis]
MSMSSDEAMDHPTFRKRHRSDEQSTFLFSENDTEEDVSTDDGYIVPSSDHRVPLERPGSPELSGVSKRSERSKGHLTNVRKRPSSDKKNTFLFSEEDTEEDNATDDGYIVPSSDHQKKLKRETSPAPSSVSMRSERSKEIPLAFRDGLASMSNDWMLNPFFPIDQRKKLRSEASPAPSSVSMRSERSKEIPLAFRDGRCSADQRVERPGSPQLSGVSKRSERSKGHLTNVRKRPSSHKKKKRLRREASPALSSVSMRSERSKEIPLAFKDGRCSADQRVPLERPGSPELSGVSKRSERSKGHLIDVRKRPSSHKKKKKLRREASPAPSSVSMRSERSNGHLINFRKRPSSHKKK